MAFIIDSLQNYQQEIVDHFKADETRRAKFDAHMRNARYREVLLRNRDPAKQAGQDRSRNSRGRKLVGPQEGEDPVDYYRARMGWRKQRKDEMKKGRDSPRRAAAAAGAGARAKSSPPRAQLRAADTRAGAATERAWSREAEPRAAKLDAETIKQTLRSLYDEVGGRHSRRTPKFEHYNGRATAKLPLRLNEMLFTSRAKPEPPKRSLSRSPPAAPTDDGAAQRVPRPPPAREQPAASEEAAPPPTGVVRTGWRPGTGARRVMPPPRRLLTPERRVLPAACEPLTEQESAEGRAARGFKVFSPWQAHPDETFNAAEQIHPAQWPFRILQPKSGVAKEGSSAGFSRDRGPSSARRTIASASSSRAKKLGPASGSTPSRHWAVADPPPPPSRRHEYTHSPRPTSAVELTSDRDLQRRPLTAPQSPPSERSERFAFPSKQSGAATARA